MKAKTKKVYAVLIGYKNDGYTGDVKIFANFKDANNYALEVLNSYDPHKGINPPYANVIEKEIL